MGGSHKAGEDPAGVEPEMIAYDALQSRLPGKLICNELSRCLNHFWGHRIDLFDDLHALACRLRRNFNFQSLGVC